MRLISGSPRPRLSDEGGFSMMVVMVVLLIGGLLVTAAFAAANSDLPFSRDSQDRKSAYAAAESGVSYYSFRLNQDNDYWTRCTNVPAPNATEPNPVNQRWGGTGKDLRNWRTVPDSTSQYTIELVPATGFTACQESNQASMLEGATGTFRVRVTGRARPNKRPHRSINLTYRRKSFLDFIYFTNYETSDPKAYQPSQQAAAESSCGNRNRSQRPNGCQEIQFIGDDRIKGPFHTNDQSILVCGNPVFGEVTDDVFEVTGGEPGYKENCSGAKPSVVGKSVLSAGHLEMPQTNAALASSALPENSFKGVTKIRFIGTQMRVSNVARFGDAAYRTMAMPANGVIYVGPNGTCTAKAPLLADYKETPTCGNVYVSGTYSRGLTIAAANDVIVGGTDDGVRSLQKSGDVLAGLIADNFVRVYNRVARSNEDDSELCDGKAAVPAAGTTPAQPAVPGEDPPADVIIDAAILSLQHSFTVDNFGADCAQRGTLTVNGAIAQKYRGAVGQSETNNGVTTRSGFIKNYTYDRRLRFRSPPFFLEPVAAAWRVIRRNEQVPAT